VRRWPARFARPGCPSSDCFPNHDTGRPIQNVR
jgi:hypothetical protein